MTALPNISFLAQGNARNQGPMRDAFFGPWLAATRELPGGDAVTTLVIDTGGVTATRAAHLIDTEGEAASDDLTHIAVDAHPEGRILVIGSASDDREVRVIHAGGSSGQILTADGATFALSHTAMRLWLQRVGSAWVEIHRSYGGIPRLAAALGLLLARREHKTASFTIAADERGVLFTLTAGANRVVNLPAASAYGANAFGLVRASGASSITLQRAGSDTIAGATSLAVQDGVLLASDGVSTWYPVGSTGSESLAAVLTEIAGLGSNGLIARTGDGTAAARTLGAGTGLTGSNLDGAGGNPSFAIDKATDANVRGAAADKVLTADLLNSAANLVTISYSATISVNWANFVNGTCNLTGNGTLGNPSNVQAGTWRTIVLTRNANNRTLGFGSNYRFPGGTPPTLTAASTSVDVIHLWARTTSEIWVFFGADMKAA